MKNPLSKTAGGWVFVLDYGRQMSEPFIVTKLT
jgi:hypothetical protein